jgi:hypothetical protein
MLTIEELKPSDCRWPCEAGSTGEMLFCGDPALEGCPYCASHAALAYDKPAGRRLDLIARPLPEPRLPFELESRP